MGSRAVKCAQRLLSSEPHAFRFQVHATHVAGACASCRWFGSAQPKSGSQESRATDTSASHSDKPPDTASASESSGAQQAEQNTDQRATETEESTAQKAQRGFKHVAQETAKLSSEVASEMARRLGMAAGQTESTGSGAGSSWAESARKMGASFTGKGKTAGEDGSSSSSSTGANGTDESGSDASGSSKQTLIEQLRSEVAKAVLPEWETPSMMKRRTDVNAREIKVGEGPTDLVVQEVPQSWFEKLQERLGNTALASRIAALRETEAMRSVADGYASVKERLEAGDSEVVNRVSEMGERFMSETETARSLREIRMRHPSFDMPSFLRAIKRDVPVVIKAYLEGSNDVLQEYCSDAMLERFTGIYKATVAQGQITDSTILEYSDVDMIDMKMLDDDPVVILHFSVQQINCVRDTYGNVVSGSPDEVNRVYYYWALQMDGHGMVTEDGQYIPPRWKLTEMLLRGMHHLL